MIESIEFTNFKALRKTTLPLAPFTLLLGPNGSGKTSVLQALRGIAVIAAQQASIPRQDLGQSGLAWPSLLSITAEDRTTPLEIKLRLRQNKQSIIAAFHWQSNRQTSTYNNVSGTGLPTNDAKIFQQWLGRIQI